MSQSVTITLPDPVYEAVRQSAEAIGSTPDEWIATKLAELLPGEGTGENGATVFRQVDQERREAEERLFRYIGALSTGRLLGADNESIDADLAAEYAGRHEDEE